MNKAGYLWNVIGQIRIYSLIDLFLFALAIHADKFEIAGILLLHLSFIFYLEHIHKHHNRVQIPKIIWLVLGFIGIYFYPSPAIIGYIICSALYVKKKDKHWSMFSPLFRGLQSYFLAAGVVGFAHPLSIFAFILLAIRNFTGDLRDVTKDKRENMNTLPILLGIKKEFKHFHLICLMLTSAIWWYFTSISIWWLVLVYIIQILTYKITSR